MQNIFPDLQKRRGLLLVLSGPSGSGKTTLYQTVLAADNALAFSVSCTTREPRPNEQDGRDYHFLSEKDFQHKIRTGQFLEYADVHGKLYGTLRAEVEDRLTQGGDVLLDIDIQGARQIRQGTRNTWLERSLLNIFVMPPSMDELRKRLNSRGTERPEVLETRLANAQSELQAWHEYDYVIINNDLQTAEHDLKSVIRAARHAVTLYTTAAN